MYNKWFKSEETGIYGIWTFSRVGRVSFPFGDASHKVIDNTYYTEEERQELVERHQDSIIEPGLPTPLHALLGQPIAHGTQFPSDKACPIGEKGGVEKGENEIKDTSHKGPAPWVPQHPDDYRDNDGGQENQENTAMNNHSVSEPKSKDSIFLSSKEKYKSCHLEVRLDFRPDDHPDRTGLLLFINGKEMKGH